jgi:autoinducer 2 (AI-2) kinase
MERSLASETLLYDLKGGDWAWDLIDALELPRNIFPAITQSGSVLGHLSKSAAEYLGLQEGISVIAGGADTQCGLLGVGAVATGQLAVIAGSTTPIQLVTGKPILDKHFRLWTGLHVIPDRWVLESNVGQTGQALDWMAGFHYRGAREPVSMMAAAATRSEPGAMGMTSSLGATLFNARAMGVPIGNITFSPILANGDPERARHIARAVLEGMAYGVQANIEQIMTAADIKQPPIKMGGGIARSDLFAQILSNVSSTTVEVPGTTEATALGAAICAAVGTGIYPDLQTAAEALVKPGRRFTPQTEHQHTYRRLYENWMELRNARQEADLLAGDMVLNALAGQSGPEAGSRTPDFRPRILITASISADEIQALSKFAEVVHQDYREEMRLLSGVDLAEELQGFHVLVTEIDIVDLDALEELPDLKVVVCCRGNPVNVDIEACTAMGIPVLNAPGRNADAVADITVG